MKSGEIVADRYKLEQKLGMGGMGTVWSAQHTQTGRLFALKIMHATVAMNEDSRQRFLKEAKASARIDHPNVIDVLDVGELPEGVLFMAMELLEGMPLADALRLEPPLSVREMLLVLRDACAALSAAHGVGIVHRDVKPANIFLHRDRASGLVRPKVLDFGVSKFVFLDENATHTGSLLGSPRYMSPEQARSAAQADARSDVWSLGVILFEALTGAYPHEGDSFSNLVVAIATTAPRRVAEVAPTVPRPLATLVDECLQPRDQRIASCEVLGARIDDLLTAHDLTNLVCVRAKNRKSIPRPEEFMVRTQAEMSREMRASLSGRSSPFAAATKPSQPALPAVQPRAAIFTESSASTTTNSLDPPTSKSSETTEVTRPGAPAPRQVPIRSRTTPMSPSAHEIAIALAKAAQLTGPKGTMALAKDPPREPEGPPQQTTLLTKEAMGLPPAPPLPSGAGHAPASPRGSTFDRDDQRTQIQSRSEIYASSGSADDHSDATRLITQLDPDAGTPTMTDSVAINAVLRSSAVTSVQSTSMLGAARVTAPLPSQAHEPSLHDPRGRAFPVVYPSEPRDHLVESVSAFGVEQHRRPAVPSGAPTGEGAASPFRRRNAGAAIVAASVTVLGLATALILVMGRGSSDRPAAPGVPFDTTSPPLVVTAAPEEAAIDPDQFPPPDAVAAPTATPSASASAAPPPSASAARGGPWPFNSGWTPPPPSTGGPRMPPGRPVPPKGCAKDKIDCLGSGL